MLLPPLRPHDIFEQVASSQVVHLRLWAAPARLSYMFQGVNTAVANATSDVCASDALDGHKQSSRALFNKKAYVLMSDVSHQSWDRPKSLSLSIAAPVVVITKKAAFSAQSWAALHQHVIELQQCTSERVGRNRWDHRGSGEHWGWATDKLCASM